MIVSGGVDLFAAEYGQCDGLACCVPVRTAEGGQAVAKFTDHGLPSLIARPDQKPVTFPQFHEMPMAAPSDRVMVKLTVELGRTRVPLKEFAALCYGDMLVLDHMVGSALKIFANGCHLGAGEVVTHGEKKYGIKLVSLVETAGTELIGS
jgi:flagellar motor switch/type III secretory pathway protein FliN